MDHYRHPLRRVLACLEENLPSPRLAPRNPGARFALIPLLLVVAGFAFGQDAATPATKAASTTPATPLTPAGTLLIIGNSFQYGEGSPVRYYRAHTVTDLNGAGTGGVAALVKAFASQAGLDYAVSIETVGGSALDVHLRQKKALIDRPWDHVVMAGYSTLDRLNPGNPGLLVRTAKEMAELLRAKNPKADIRLIATWSRADQTYPDAGHWHGKPIEAMALDIRAAYDLAAAGAPAIRAVIPVGEAWLRAMKTGVADPNPYDGIAFGQVDLWTHDHYHASAYGYYLEALMIFGDLTGLDPRSLAKTERTAIELGFSAVQATALQKVAFDELTATKGRAPLKEFTPVALAK